MSSPFNRLPGSAQLRIKPTGPGIVALDGNFDCCLGEDLPGVFMLFNLNDKIELSQPFDITTIKLVTIRADFRMPKDASLGKWVFSWLLDTTQYGSRTLTPGARFTVRDAAVDVSQLTGNHTIKLRLQLVAP